jgi:hypothetical protein
MSYLRLGWEPAPNSTKQLVLTREFILQDADFPQLYVAGNCENNSYVQRVELSENDKKTS